MRRRRRSWWTAGSTSRWSPAGARMRARWSRASTASPSATIRTCRKAASSGCSRSSRQGRVPMSAMKIAGLVTLGLVLAGAPALAQSGGSSGAIHGVITDESGATLPGVVATLTSPALQVRQITTVSDAGGNYRFGELPVGVYKITFDLSGFTTLIRDELRLPVGFDAKVDAVMKIGSLEESVTVTGGSPVIDLTTTTKSVTLNTEILNEIPRGRDLSMVYSMAPGVTLAGTPDVGGSNMANRQNISAGGVALQPKLQIEGMNIVLSDDQNSGVYFNSDTLEEIQIKTSGNDASVGVPGISMV